MDLATFLEAVQAAPPSTAVTLGYDTITYPVRWIAAQLPQNSQPLALWRDKQRQKQNKEREIT